MHFTFGSAIFVFHFYHSNATINECIVFWLLFSFYCILSVQGQKWATIYNSHIGVVNEYRKCLLNSNMRKQVIYLSIRNSNPYYALNDWLNYLICIDWCTLFNVFNLMVSLNKLSHCYTLLLFALNVCATAVWWLQIGIWHCLY